MYNSNFHLDLTCICGYVPKPRVRADAPAPATEAERRHEGGDEGDEALDALAVLERQHAEHQRAAAAIRAELGLS